MPAGVVEREDDAALTPGAGLPREGGEQFDEERLGEAGREILEVSPLVGCMKAITWSHRYR